MGKPVCLEVQPGLWAHACFLYPDIDTTGLSGVDSLRVKTHTDGMRLFSWFLLLLPEWLIRTGSELRGYSIRQSKTEWLLVVRVSNEGIPQVAFTSGANPMDCIRLFRSRLERMGAIWYPDKYG